ncbi:DUF732 domain-containing protein [Streptomyces sp. NBC_01244]|uniref:DUF732 domain-containing protein n=1 Tax=Streptomyces sp. NBC_01244 TaxID=2903797 RepID=UPI002E109619|nr:hypothetical protein OG247_17970 [Streptomyces sp. NBC_01244]
MRRFTLPAVVITAVFALTACGSGADDKPKAEAPVAAPSSVPAKPAAVPSPDAAQTKALMTALKGIKPELAADEERAVRRAQNVCQEVKAGKDEAAMATNANARFSGGTAGQLSDAQGAKIVKAVKDSFCQ